MSLSHLDRKLTLFPVTNIVIANIIGASIFTTSGLLMQNLANPIIMLILWVVGGLIALSGALAYGELGATFPGAGGEYLFLSRIYHPFFGFLSGWVSLFAGFSAPIAASAIGFSVYLFRAFPILGQYSESTFMIGEEWMQRLVAILIILLFTAVHLRGIQYGARVQNALTILKILLVVGLILLGFFAGNGNWSHLTQFEEFKFNFDSWKTIGLSLMWIMFAYSGWNAATYIGSEIKNPRKNLPLSLFLGTGIVVVIYFFINLFYIYAVDPESMKGVISISGLAVNKAFGRTFDTTVSILIAFALFSSLSAFIILGPRVYYAMAKDRLFFKSFANVHPETHVPARSIILQGGIAALMVLTGSFDQILSYMGFSLGIFPLMAVFGIFKLRRNGQTDLKISGYPILPVFYLLSGLLILFLAFFERPVESSLAIITVLAGFPVYILFKRRSIDQ
jgi:APA family basic amino acid/polyamine antiporter